MPRYDYKCPKKKCGQIEEQWISLKDLDATKIYCSKCKVEMKRLMSATEFQIAGYPPRDFQPLKKNNPKSHIEPIRRKKA